MSTIAIITAAGKGVRIGAPVAKQFLPVLGKPLLWHTIKVFENCPGIDNIILVLPPDMVKIGRELFQTKGEFKKLWKVVAGGKTRQQSVSNGLRAIPEKYKIVVVHDGVRPLVNEDTIKEVIELAKEKGAAIAAMPANDTLKQVSADGCIIRTVERSLIWQAQTPQAFRAELLRRAFTEAQKDNFYGTDEASLVERLEEPVYIIKGASTNIKVTTPADLKLVEILLRYRYGDST
ncbi:MAG: 2-C-methyl-D-erythritol 4-phosphate cytidylyltransferase [Thermodesulfobacteriota bacterium]|nr:2-C-methyl-D-erythritol 4-phosphate cytidylyltransferase [Thermodesulfobacteriota bacterium]